MTIRIETNDGKTVSSVEFNSWKEVTTMTAEKWVRKCNNCNTPMMEGYCIAGGEEYYCTDECLHKHITPEEWDNLYADGESDSYWTQWEEGEDE